MEKQEKLNYWLTVQEDAQRLADNAARNLSQILVDTLQLSFDELILEK